MSLSAIPGGPPPPLKDWSVFVYAGGVNNLDSYLTQNIDELAKGHVPGSVNVLVRHVNARGELNDLQVTSDGKVPLDSGQLSPVDSAAPECLASFLRRGIQKFPAHHYLVVVSSHGKGADGLVEDELHHSIMSPGQLKGALDEARRANQGRPLDCVFFNACRMMAVEVAAEMQGSALVAVGSMDRIEGHGFDPVQLIEATVNSANGFEVGRKMVANQETRQLSVCNSLSAVDLGRMGGLQNAIADFSHELSLLEPTEARQVRQIALQARRSTPSPAFMDALNMLADYILTAPKHDDELKDWLEMTRPGDPVSIVSLCQGLLADNALMTRRPGLQAATGALLQAHQAVVISSRDSEEPQDPGALTLCLPIERMDGASLYGSPLALEENTRWSKAVDIVVPVGVPAPPRYTWLEEELGLPRPTVA